MAGSPRAKGSVARKGVARPELRGWIDEVLGQEWNRIRKMKMPSNRSGAAVTKPGMRNKNRGKRRRR